MGEDLDPTKGTSAQALLLFSRRANILAANMANVDTPNYKARDIDFRVALAAAAQRTEPLGMTTTAPHHLKGELPSPESRLMYRVPLAPALDGNTVDSDLEQAAFAENNVRYQASLSFVSDEFRG